MTPSMGKSTLPYCGLVVSVLGLLLPINDFHRARAGFQESDVLPLTDFYLSGMLINGACDLVSIWMLDYPKFWISFVHFNLLLIVWLTANTLRKKYMRELSRRSRIGGKVACEYLLTCKAIFLVDISKINQAIISRFR